MLDSATDTGKIGADDHFNYSSRPMANCRRWCTISVRGLLLWIAIICVTLIPVHRVVRRIEAIEVLNRRV